MYEKYCHQTGYRGDNIEKVSFTKVASILCTGQTKQPPMRGRWNVHLNTYIFFVPGTMCSRLGYQ